VILSQHQLSQIKKKQERNRMENKDGSEIERTAEAIKSVCTRGGGGISPDFLCRSIGSLNLPNPVLVKLGTSLSVVLSELRRNKIGSVLVVDQSGMLKGIFTERDCILKLSGFGSELESLVVDNYMTKDPTTERPDTTVAYALNLMSHGGFRNIPITDTQGFPIGVLSVKDVVDALVQSFTKDLLDLELDFE